MGRLKRAEVKKVKMCANVVFMLSLIMTASLEPAPAVPLAEFEGFFSSLGKAFTKYPLTEEFGAVRRGKYPLPKGYRVPRRDKYAPPARDRKAAPAIDRVVVRRAIK